MKLQKGQPVWVKSAFKQAKVVKVLRSSSLQARDQLVKVRFPAWDGFFYADQLIPLQKTK